MAFLLDPDYSVCDLLLLFLVLQNLKGDPGFVSWLPPLPTILPPTTTSYPLAHPSTHPLFSSIFLSIHPFIFMSMELLPGARHLPKLQ